jgi:hypothetical protein
MKKLFYLMMLVATTTFIFSCKSNEENGVNSLELSNPDVITVIYNDGRVQHFCPKEEGSTTYTPCPSK